METEISPTSIAKRLEALNKWHEEYRMLLSTKHEQQKAIFEMSQSPMAKNNTMQTIDILYPNEDNNLEKDISGLLLFDENMQKSSTEQISPKRNTSGYVTSESKLEDTDSKESLRPPNTKKEASQNCENQASLPVPPRKFLRKGEGIKQRFKIDADAFNLSKLPPYKYAKLHAKRQGKQRKQPKVNALQPKETRQPPIETRNVPIACESAPLRLDTHEIRFQRLLFASKTVCNSTPESKASSTISVAMQSQGDTTDKMHITANSQNSQLQDSSSLGIAWSKVLNPLNVKPIPVAQLREQSDTVQQQTPDNSDDGNLNLFELLEEKAKEGSFNLNCSLIRKILDKNMAAKNDKEDASDIVPVSAELRQAHIEPKVDKAHLSSSIESEGESEAEETESEREEEDEENESDSGDSVAGSEEAEHEKAEKDTEVEDEEERATIVNSNFTANSTHKSTSATNVLRVRFVDEESNDTQTDSRMDNKLAENSTSHVDSSALFEQMKTLVLAALNKNENPSDTALMSTPPMNAVEVKKLAEQGRKRVAELEEQIALFKETNLQLMKAKQEHELEKVFFAQQQEEAMEQINDEKIKMEIELHDERMKLEQARRRLEEKSRMQRTAIASNERKEIFKLKEEINMLQNKLREKDQQHTSAQARLRSQLRVLEREQKALYEEIERLNKEKLKLEKQIAQQTRERNATMLSEINRNIVKLAKNNSNTSVHNRNEKLTLSQQPMKKAEEKQAMAQKKTKTQSSFDEINEPLKALKITKNSFQQLMSSNADDTQKQQISDEEEEDDKQSPKNDVNIADEHIRRQKQMEKTLAFSATAAEKENSMEKTTSGLKMLTREIINPDGGKEIIYPNGTIRKESGDGLTVRMMYFNGDVKETNVKEGTIKYYYSKTNTWHTTYLDGLEIIEFPNGQIEHRLPSGVIEVHYPHKNCVKIMDPKDPEKEAEYVYDDGTKVCEMRNGNKLLTLPNGQKELTTKEFKRREYPDGTIKTVYPDGSHETRYSNGRLRLKDKDGNLIIDSEMQTPALQQHQQKRQSFASCI